MTHQGNGGRDWTRHGSKNKSHHRAHTVSSGEETQFRNNAVKINATAYNKTLDEFAEQLLSCEDDSRLGLWTSFGCGKLALDGYTRSVRQRVGYVKTFAWAWSLRLEVRMDKLDCTPDFADLMLLKV